MSRPWCEIRPEGDSLVVIRFGGLHEEDFADAIADLKVAVPAWGRRYDRTRRCWIIEHFWRAEVEDWARRWFDENPEIPIDPERAAAFRALHLLPSAPMELIHIAYRTLALKAHPDTGGSEDAMRRLNRAREVLIQGVPA